MKLCIYGSSGIGKSTLAKVLTRAICNEIRVVHGDHFIRRDEELWDDLKSELVGSSTFIFDHVSSPAVLQRLGISPDIAIGIVGSASNDHAGNGRALSSEHFNRQTQIARSAKARVFEVQSVSEGLLRALAELRAAGIPKLIIDNFIVKVARQCNMNCPYCYMYHGHDTSPHSSPNLMSLKVAAAAGQRIAEHHRNTGCKNTTIILHGGEPLLASARWFDEAVPLLRGGLGSDEVTFSIQTNGTLITDHRLKMLDSHGFQIGISVDGADAHTNRNRVYANGKPASADIFSGITRCKDFKFQTGRFGGILCVVDPAADGASTYRGFRSMGIESIDFLLRDETHVSAPGGATAEQAATGFLCEAFDAWLKDTEICDVRLFNALIAQLVGSNFGLDSFGLYPTNALGISVDGAWELLDILRICWPGAWQTPFNVREHSIRDVTASAVFAKLGEWQYDLPNECLGCRHLVACGGGYLPHRYHPERLFKSPSVHCATIMGTLDHIVMRLREHRLIR